MLVAEILDLVVYSGKLTFSYSRLMSFIRTASIFGTLVVNRQVGFSMQTDGCSVNDLF